MFRIVFRHQHDCKFLEYYSVVLCYFDILFGECLMSASLSDEEIEQIKAYIEELKLEHRDLDLIIERLSQDALVEQLQIKRLKKRKLQLKDLVARLEDKLIPDILA